MGEAHQRGDCTVRFAQPGPGGQDWSPIEDKMHEETMATIELWKREIEACERTPIVDTTRVLGLRTLVPRKYEQKLLDNNHATFSEAKRCIIAQGNLLRSAHV